MGGIFGAGSAGLAKGSQHVVRSGSEPGVAAPGEVVFLWF